MRGVGVMGVVAIVTAITGVAKIVAMDAAMAVTRTDAR
jgi:hypothetical protein